MTTSAERVSAWIDTLIDRHTASFSTSEFLKAVRALSARYVEGRHELGTRSPLDSAGKRAAFAGFYAPLHFITARAALHALAPLTDVNTIVDLGCGTGVVGAAWAIEAAGRPEIVGVDRHPWVLNEAQWNWRTLGLRGRTRRGDLDQPLASIVRSPETSRKGSVGLAFGWSINELSDQRRATLLPDLLALSSQAPVIVLEPLARSAAPWWQSWAKAFETAGGQAHEWKLDLEPPPRLAQLDEGAGFRRDTIGVRCLWLPGRPQSSR